MEGFIETLATCLEPYFGVKCSLIEPAGTKSEFVGRVMSDLGGTLPNDSAYGPIARDYMEALKIAGSFTNGQEPFEVADVIIACFESDRPHLRNPTSDRARTFCTEKLAADPHGDIQLARIRKDLLGK